MPRTEHDYVALSCVCVGVGPGGTTSMVARVAITSWFGNVQFEAFVSPGNHAVTDYRTSTTGITARDLNSPEALSFPTVQQKVAGLIKGKVLVGHCLWNDLSVLGIPHPAVDTRDVALYMPFRNGSKTQHIIGLPTLMWNFMNRKIQQAGSPVHPVENARAVMDLYRSCNTVWEAAIEKRNWPCLLPPDTFSSYLMLMVHHTPLSVQYLPSAQLLLIAMTTCDVIDSLRYVHCDSPNHRNQKWENLARRLEIGWVISYPYMVVVTPK